MTWALIPLEALTSGQPELKVPHKTPILSLHLIKWLALAMQNLRVKTEPSRLAETAAAKAKGAIMPLSDLWALACPCNQMSEPLIHTGHWGYNDMRVLGRLNTKEKGFLPARPVHGTLEWLPEGGSWKMIDPYFFLHSRETVGVEETHSYHWSFCFSDRSDLTREKQSLLPSLTWWPLLLWPSVRRDLDGAVCCGFPCLCTFNLASVWLGLEIRWAVENSIKMLNLGSN